MSRHFRAKSWAWQMRHLAPCWLGEAGIRALFELGVGAYHGLDLKVVPRPGSGPAFTVDDIRAATERMREANPPPYRCPNCSRSYYLGRPRHYQAGQELVVACLCGYEAIVAGDHQSVLFDCGNPGSR